MPQTRLLRGLSLLLLVSAFHVRGEQGGRRLLQGAGGNIVSPDVRIAAKRLSEPFLKIRDTETVSGREAQRLYEQASSVAVIADLLLGAAEPLSVVDGSSGALLPYLRFRVLRAYASQPGLCSSTLVEQLYGLSQSLYGTPALQACQYNLFKALRATFTWVATSNTIPLTFQKVPGQPDTATAAWPDVSAISDADFTVAVSAALLTRPELSEAATLLTNSCGLDVPQFARLVPTVSSVLLQLHADLKELKRISDAATVSVLPRSQGTAGSQRRSALGTEDAALEAPRRRLVSMLPPRNLVTELPPASFQVKPPSSMPKLLVPLVLHVLSYRDGNTTGPAGLEQTPMYAQRMLRILNLISKPTNISFFFREIRYNASTHPYLLQRNRKNWLQQAAVENCTVPNCLMTSDFVEKNSVDFPRSINIYITSDATALDTGILGYVSDICPSDTIPSSAFMYIGWDQLTLTNSDAGYNDGIQTFLHELFHYLGVLHTFQRPLGAPSCLDGDLVQDTPAIKGPVFVTTFWGQAARYCLDIFWNRYGGDMEALIQRASSAPLGIPDLDKNAWADSCPKRPGYDELGNYMTYTAGACLATLGHFTAEQAQNAHFWTSEFQPLLYAWAQYYAAQAAPPPTTKLAPPPPLDLGYACRHTILSGCACKSSWQYNGTTYSYCADPFQEGVLWCEVENNPNHCVVECVRPSKKNPNPGPCYRHCAGTPELCKLPARPLATVPRPSWPPAPPPPLPRPPSPPPRPPPPPPDNFPQACKVSTSGCACRSTWNFAGDRGRYCSEYKQNSVLRCLVTPDCPSFWTSPLQSCNPALNATYCGGGDYWFDFDSPNPVRKARPPPPPAPRRI